MDTATLRIDTEKRRVSGDVFDFYIVQDGYYRLDGGSMYGMVPKTIWSRIEEHDEQNRLYMCMNCLLAHRGDQLFLVDTGIGEKLDPKGKRIFGIEGEHNLIQEIMSAGFTPDQVTHVIPTHLHFDHAGWIVDNYGNLTFPNANYYIQQAEWAQAQNPHTRFKDSYLMEYYQALEDSPRLVLLDGDTEIEEGIWAYLVPGHSRGHQVVLFDDGPTKVAHLGDVCAMAAQIRLNWTCGFDGHPEETITHKEPLLNRALEEKWLVVPAHDRKILLGQVEMEKGKHRLKKVL